ncbi:MAG: tyrosine-type recombinase/integrase [Acidimicrobiales bacterium]
MSAFAQNVEEYLRLRRALGHQLADAARLLPRFVAHLDSLGAATITVEVALGWVQLPDNAGPTSSVWMRRMTAVRGFARYLSGIDPATEVPPLGLVTFRRHWRPPFIYAPADVEALMAEVPRVVPSELRAATFRTMIGLLAATGMRVGEAIALRRADVDWGDGVLVVRAAKFGKSRELPLQRSTVDALGSYADERDRWVPRPEAPTFFVSRKGTPVIYTDFGERFRELVRRTGVGADSPVSPRVHDLRHSFAVATLVHWYRAGEDVGALLPRLSTYLGHLTPGYTYWYLSAAPELLALAAARLDKAKGTIG